MIVKHNLSINMSEQDIEQLEAEIQDEEQELDNEPEDVEDIEALKAKLAEKEAEVEREKAAKRQLFARLKKGVKPHIKNNTDLADDVVKDVTELKLAEKKRQFGHKHGLSPEETDKLFRYTGDGNPEETLKDPFFQSALEASRRKKDIDDAVPGVSSRAKKVDGKTFAEMTEEERKKNWGKITQAK